MRRLSAYRATRRQRDKGKTKRAGENGVRNRQRPEGLTEKRRKSENRERGREWKGGVRGSGREVERGGKAQVRRGMRQNEKTERVAR